jgi:signal transduction histidine kinase
MPVGLGIVGLVAALVEARRAATEAASRERRYLDALPDVAIVLDPETWIIEYANTATSRASGVESMIGSPVERLLPDARTTLVVDGPNSEIGLRTADGDMPVEVGARSVESPSGDTRILVTAHDMSERIESEIRLTRMAAAERSQQRVLAAIIESMDDGVALLGSDGHVLIANDALSALVGGPTANADDLAVALGGSVTDGPREIGDPPRSVQVMVRSLTDERNATRLVLVRDTTVEVEAAATRDAFLGVLSHELRTPITTILGLAHVMRRSGRLDEPTNGLITDVAEEAERLEYLIEDLLVLSRAQAGAVAFEAEPVLLQHAIREVIAAESRRASLARFEIDCPDSLPPVDGDRTFVRQVLRNLIGNAAKYGPSTDAVVTVSAETSGGFAVVRVIDQGPGVQEEARARIFDIFYRAERTAKQRSGSGIGLYVTRTLVEAMGGRVWLEPNDGRGSTFAFTLPHSHVDDADT